MIKSILARLGYEISRSRFVANRPASQAADDFNWDEYTDYYKNELIQGQQDHSLRLSASDYVFDKFQLVKHTSRAPLHPNHRLLYETVLVLDPRSVLEVGCGGGDHLFNLSSLKPTMSIFGVDRSTSQLEFAANRWPPIKDRTMKCDITLPYTTCLPSVDLVYTQAVIMHIKTGNGHLVALSNLFRIAEKQVVLMENWSHHQFLSDIQFLHRERMIPWEDVFFYFRRSPEYGDKPHVMIISSIPLDLEPLVDYSVLQPKKIEWL